MHPRPRPLRARTLALALLCTALTTLTGPALSQNPAPLPDPDGQPADMTKPVQVYILLGQSNMLGFGNIDQLKPLAPDKYPYLVDDAGNWTVRQDVRNVRVMNDQQFNNEWMTITGKTIGPEIGIGHHLGNVTDAPVLILKSCIGNRSLGWDLLPPGSEPYMHGGKMQPGYRGTYEAPQGNGEIPQGAGWYAGKQYDSDVAAAKRVLDNLQQYYPGATEYEVVGFFWWQGDKDMRNPAHFERYEQNLIQLIKALRNDFNAPNARFVTASLGQTVQGSTGGDGKILDAMAAVANSNDPELKGKVGFVYTHPLSKGGSSSGHYNGNPETYMNVGQVMGHAMVQLIANDNDNDNDTDNNPSDAGPAEQIDHQPRTWTSTNGSTLTATFISATRGRVTLLLDNGRKRQYGISSFSEEDQAYIEKYAEKE